LADGAALQAETTAMMPAAAPIQVKAVMVRFILLLVD
jgi:hypothetical protein